MKLEAVTKMLAVDEVSGVSTTLHALAAIILVKIDLSRGFGEGFKSTPTLWKIGGIGRLLCGRRLRLRSRRPLNSSSSVGDAMKLKASTHAVGLGDGGTFLGNMSGQAVDPALRKVLSALLAGMGISIAVVVELGASYKVLEDEGVGFTTHCAGSRAVASAWPATSSVRGVKHARIARFPLIETWSR